MFLGAFTLVRRNTPPELDTSDRDAFRALVNAEAPRVARLARRLAPAGVDADDLTQDVFERAWRNRDRFRGDSTATTWLHAILVNRLRDLARARREPEAQLSEDDELRLLDLLVDDPAAALARAEAEDELRAALTSLPLEERTAVALHDGEAWTAAEIAAVCGCSVDAAHKRIQRGRFRLAAAIANRAAQPETRGGAPLSCRSARLAASAFLDGDLPPALTSQVEQHLSVCNHCPPVMQTVVGIRGALAREPTGALPPTLRERLERTLEAAR